MKLTQIQKRIAARARALVRDEMSGQVLLEFALVAPLVLLLCLGMCVFGIGLNEDLVLTNATELASQQLAVSRGQTTDPCLTVNNTLVNAAPNLTPTSLTITVTLNGVSSGALTGQTTNPPKGTSQTAMCTSMAADMIEGDNETVTVTYPYTASFINFGTKSYTLSATLQQVIE